MQELEDRLEAERFVQATEGWMDDKWEAERRY